MVSIYQFKLRLCFLPIVAEDREMFRHRLAPEADYYRLPVSPPAQFRPASFLLYPIGILPGFGFADLAQAIYVVAFEQALEAGRPALVERDLFAFWN